MEKKRTRNTAMLPLAQAYGVLLESKFHNSIGVIIVQSTYVILDVTPSFFRSMMRSVICGDLVRLKSLL